MVVDIVVACLVDCWLLGDCIGKNRNTSSGQDFRIYSLKIHLQDKDIVTLHGIYSKNIDWIQGHKIIGSGVRLDFS